MKNDVLHTNQMLHLVLQIAKITAEAVYCSLSGEILPTGWNFDSTKLALPLITESHISDHMIPSKLLPQPLCCISPREPLWSLSYLWQRLWGRRVTIHLIPPWMLFFSLGVILKRCSRLSCSKAPSREAPGKYFIQATPNFLLCSHTDGTYKLQFLWKRHLCPIFQSSSCCMDFHIQTVDIVF